MPSYVQVVLGVALALGGLAALLLIRRRHDGVDEAYESAAALVNPQSCDCEDCDGATAEHDDFDMTDDERNAEIDWLKQLYGPPVSPGRD